MGNRVFTYANAVHQALKRIGDKEIDAGEPIEVVRALIHGAMALYLARYLNVPPAALPGEGGDQLGDLPVAADKIPPLCSTRSIASSRSTLQHAWSLAISSWVTRPSR